MAEVEEAERPRRSLRLCTAGAEPLGSLRYAFARSIAVHGPAPDGALSETELQALEDLLAGEGIDDDLGAAIVARWTLLEGNAASGNAPGGSADNREPADVAGVVLIDDATEIDDPSLDVVAKAAVVPGAPVRIVMRLDGGSLLPPSFDKLPAGPQILLPALEPDDALALASELAPVPLTAEAAATWAERGRHVPLGIAEAIALGRGTGAFEASGARASFAPDTDLGLDATEWIRRRYDLLSNDAKMVLRACAVLGLDVEKALLHELVELGPAIATAAAMQELVAEGWLEERAGYCTFASRTHREVVSEDVVDDEEKRLHGSASILVEKRGGKLAAAEAARHAAMAGDHPRSVELALAAAEMSRVLGLDGACEALLAFVGANPHGFAALPTPTTVFRLESWIEALRASGEHDGAASRLEAIALLAKGETGAALAALRDGVTQARSSSAAMRSRAALAYGIGLAVAGQPTEALFTALEALARAREGGEARGERACARFLTRLCEGAGRGAAAATWQNIAGERTIPPPRGSMPPPRA